MAYDYLRDPAEITRRSFAIVAAEAGLAGLPPDIAPLARRLVHASGMTDLVADLAWSPGAVEAGRAALAEGRPIVCDVAMVAAGIARHRLPAENDILIGVTAAGVVGDVMGGVVDGARDGVVDGVAAGVVDSVMGGVVAPKTRCAAGMEALAGRLGGAIVAVGNAPTALFRLLELVEAGAPKPMLVLGFPVGFVGAAESKAALAANPFGLSFVTLHGRRGGSAMAAAAVNALILKEKPGGP